MEDLIVASHPATASSLSIEDGVDELDLGLMLRRGRELADMSATLVARVDAGALQFG